jgi:hypothetical protein
MAPRCFQATDEMLVAKLMHRGEILNDAKFRSASKLSLRLPPFTCVQQPSSASIPDCADQPLAGGDTAELMVVV